MPERDSEGPYPGYDVLAKRSSPSWNDKTRTVIDERLSLPAQPRFFDAHEFATVQAIAARLVPQPRARPPIPVAAMVDHKMHTDRSDGYRRVGMPRQREAWRQGLAALDAEAREAHGKDFLALSGSDQDDLLRRLQKGRTKSPAWGAMPPKDFFETRLARDVVAAYYSYPSAWSEIGWGGPASPRGYVRMGFDERDPWEGAEVRNGDVEAARRKNLNV